MPRYNLFQLAHNTVQDVLFEGAKSLQQACTGNIETAGPARQKVAEAMAAFQMQVQVIAAFIFPAADPFEPAIIDAAKQLQQTAASYEAKLEAALNKEKEITHLQQLYYRCMVQQLTCLQKTEEMLNPVLWHYYTDAELKKLEEHLNAVVPAPRRQLAA